MSFIMCFEINILSHSMHTFIQVNAEGAKLMPLRIHAIPLRELYLCYSTGNCHD